MYIFMYMCLLDITAAPERKKIERKIKYIVVRNCLSKDMDRRIAPEYRRDYDATRRRTSSIGGTARHRVVVAFNRQKCPFSQIRLAPFRYLKCRHILGTSRHRYDTLKGVDSYEGGVWRGWVVLEGLRRPLRISASVTRSSFSLPLFLLPFSTSTLVNVEGAPLFA